VNTLTCDRCLECKSKGDRFCSFCGSDLSYIDCNECEEHRRKGERFCSFCGNEVNPPVKESTSTKATVLAGIILTVALSLYLIYESITAVWGITVVWDHLPSYTHGLFVVIPKVVTFFRFGGTGLQIYYLLIMIAALSSVVYLFVMSYKPVKEEGIKGLKKTPIYEVMTLFSALMFLEVMYIIILNSSGVETTSPFDEEDWEMMFSLLNASVYEEIICRILYLGVPMCILGLILKKKGTPVSGYIFGGFGMSKLSFVFIVFSAAMFAMAHLGGWGWWKILPTFIFGLISGFLFCKYGIYATISIHFLTDYMGAATWLSNPMAGFLYTVAVLAAFLGGIPFVQPYTSKGIKWLRKEFGKKSSEESGKDSL
jgi:hypothetical protein